MHSITRLHLVISHSDAILKYRLNSLMRPLHSEGFFRGFWLLVGCGVILAGDSGEMLAEGSEWSVGL